MLRKKESKIIHVFGKLLTGTNQPCIDCCPSLPNEGAGGAGTRCCNEMSGCVVFRLPAPEGDDRKTLLVNFFSEAQSSRGLINVNLLYQRHLFCRYRNVLTAGSISGNISQCLYSAHTDGKPTSTKALAQTLLMLVKADCVFRLMGMKMGLKGIQVQFDHWVLLSSWSCLIFTAIVWSFDFYVFLMFS